MRVFISHSSKDKPAVEQLARQLRERGFEAWLDRWEMGPGDDIVLSINSGLEQADAGIIVFSDNSRESRWVQAETSYLMYARVQESKALIPVVMDESAWMPPLLRPLARCHIGQIEAIVDALRLRHAGRPPVRPPEAGHVDSVLICLRRDDAGAVHSEVQYGTVVLGSETYSRLSSALSEVHVCFLRGLSSGVRSPAAAEAAALERSLLDLGRELRALCLPGHSGESLATILDGCGVGTTVEICFEANDPELLGLPFEALRLRDDRVLALHPNAVVFRRPLNLKASGTALLAGPIKILVAVGAPDKGRPAPWCSIRSANSKIFWMRCSRLSGSQILRFEF